MGAPVAFVSIVTDPDGSLKVFRRRKMGSLSSHYKLSRTYYRHSSSPDFSRIITTVHDYKGEIERLAFVQYCFDRHEHSIDLKPHGNSKGSTPFCRTKPSTLLKLKASVQTKAPRKALREVEQCQGGVSGAKSACDLPRNRKQVKNLKYSLANQSSSSTLPKSDVLAHVMQMCKDSCGTDSVFVQSVEAAPEPMCVLATPQQLVDMERFCTGSPSSVLSLDPTFNLGAFYVTPTTYHNLLVKTSSGSHPILLGPILIHKTKTFRPFHYFLSTLIRLNPCLINLKAYGTDGESEMIKALEISFPKAVHLRCTNHLRQNIKEKLRSLHIPPSVSQEIIADVFGKRVGSHFESGLADAKCKASFAKMLDAAKTRWNNLEKSCSASPIMPQFHSWFCRYQAEVILKSVVPEVRRQAGCMNPSCHFTTNSSESINHVIKLEVEWRESKLPHLIESLKTIVGNQVAEFERAVVGRGEWRFSAEYESLVVAESRWFSQMNAGAKKLHMKKVFRQAPINAHTSTSNPQSILGVSVDESGINGIAKATLQHMWTRAESLVQADGHIISVPWSDDAKARLVKSSSSTQPHLVTRDSKNSYLYRCDSNCPMFKGFCICSHVIATAHSNDELKLFLDNVNKCKPNLSAIANHGMPSGTGRKGGVAKRKRSGKVPAMETSAIRPCLDSALHTVTNQSKSSAFVNPLSPSQPLSTSLGAYPSQPLSTGDGAYSSQPLYGAYSSQPLYGAYLSQPLSTGDGSSPSHPLSTGNGVYPSQPLSTGDGSSPSYPLSTGNGVYPSQPLSSSPSHALSTGNGVYPSQPLSTGDGSSPLSTGNGVYPSQPLSSSPSLSTGNGASSIPVSTPGSVVTTIGTANISTQGQLVFGTNVANSTIPSSLPNCTPSRVRVSAGCSSTKKPFVLKFKTNQIRVCQSCRKNYDGPNDTLGLVVARAERRLVSNLSTGVQFQVIPIIIYTCCALGLLMQPSREMNWLYLMMSK